MKSKFKLAVKNRGQSQRGQRRNNKGLESCYQREMRELEKQLKKTDPDAVGSPPPHNLHLYRMNKFHPEAHLAAIFAQVSALMDAA